VPVGGASADRLVFEGPLVVYATASDVQCPGDDGGGGAGGRGGSVWESGSGIGSGSGRVSKSEGEVNVKEGEK
jgi:hypothetical protein